MKDEILKELKVYVDSKMNFTSPIHVYNCKAAYTSDNINAGKIYLNNTNVFQTQQSSDNYQTIAERDSDGYLKIKESGFYTISMSGSAGGTLAMSGIVDVCNKEKEKLNTIYVFIDYTHTTSYYNHTASSITIYLEKDQHLKPYWNLESDTISKSFYADIDIFKNFK